MRIAVLYINAGKGHFIPSVAIVENLIAQGHTAQAFDCFKDVYGRADVAQVASNWWRYMLKHPILEKNLEYLLDRIPYVSKKSYKIAKKTTDKFLQWYNEFKPEVIITTQYTCSYVIPQMVHELNLPVCVCAYSPDTYVTPIQTKNKYTYKYFIASEEGKEQMMKALKVPSDKIELCAFPLRKDCYQHENLTKQEARKNLGFKDMFTVLINLGGEGIASTPIIDTLLEKRDNIQIVVVGTLPEETKKHFDALKEKYPEASLFYPGYVTNMNLYLCACDMLVGKAGPNAMTEAMYCRRPYMVTSLLYMSKYVVGYFVKYKIGWYASKVKDQVDIILQSKNDPNFLPTMEKNFDSVPMMFGADKLAKQIVEVATCYFDEHK